MKLIGMYAELVRTVKHCPTVKSVFALYEDTITTRDRLGTLCDIGVVFIREGRLYLTSKGFEVLEELEKPKTPPTCLNNEAPNQTPDHD